MKDIKKTASGKKLVRAAIFSLLVLIAITGGLTGIVHLPVVQNYLGRQVLDLLEKNVGTRFSFSSLRIGLFRPLMINDFLIRDRQGDTLIYARHVIAWPDMHLTSLRERGVVIDRARVDGAYVRFIVPADTASNYEFLFSKDPDKAGQSPFYLALRQAEIHNSRFTLEVQDVGFRPYGVHFTDLHLRRVEGQVKDLEIFNGITTLSARDVSFIDATGWKVNKVSCDIENSPRHLWFDNLHIVTPWSDLRADYYHMDFDTVADYRDFPDKVQLSGKIRPSHMGYRDLNAIAQTPHLLHNDIRFSGKAHGTLSNLVIKDLHLELEKNTSMKGDINIVGLPDFADTYLHITVREMHSTMEDIAGLYRPGTDRKLTIPSDFMKFGNISYRGKFTGFVKDFVSYGSLITDIGRFDDDISISADTSGHLHFNGYLAMRDFDIGTFTGEKELLGKVTMHANMHGTIYNDKTFSSLLTGTIDSITVNRYTYHSILVDGKFSEKAYDGSIKVNDPNLKLDFLGMFDFTKDLPEFDFSLNLLHAALFPMNITPSDTNLTLSGLVLASFSGNNLQEFQGNIKLLDATLKREKEHLNIYNVQLQAYNSPDSGSLQLRSDYLDALVQGRYNFQQLLPSLRHLLARYLPATFARGEDKMMASNDFFYRIDIHNIDPFTEFFWPGGSLSHNSYLRGRYAPVHDLFQLEAAADEVVTPTMAVDSLRLQVVGNDVLSAHIEGDYLFFGPRLHTDHFSADITAARDTLRSHFAWLAPVDTMERHDHLRFTAHLFIPSGRTHPRMTLTTAPTALLLGPRIWHLDRNSITVDSTAILVRHFLAQSGDKALNISGTLSEAPTDTLRATFHNLDISYLTSQEQKDLRLKGIMNGEILLSNIYHDPIFLSTTTIRDFYLNGEPLGYATINSAWDTLADGLAFDLHTDYGQRRPVSITGIYRPNDRKLKMDILFDKFRLTAFSSFVSEVFSSLNGNVSGRLHAEGDLLRPRVRGQLQFRKVSLKVGYLNTTYTFTADVPVRNNRFLADSVVVFDEQGHKGVLNGSFIIEELLAPAIDMTLKADKMLVLNTRSSDNEYFYGRGVASGAVVIRGPLDAITMNITARTEPATAITLPLTESRGESIETDFIHFVNPHQEKKKKRYPVQRERAPRPTSFQLNLDLQVTPDAEVTLLFDPAAGGTLYGRGHGDLRMEVNRNGDFSLYGEYIIDEGTYRFTLQNVINKKFRLENGGRITWNGDPLNAQLDILAVYPLKTSLYPLFFDDNYRKRVPVECQILLKGSLNNPLISFNIDLPTVDEDTRAKVRNSMSSEEELSKQFLSLLIINSFYPNPVYNQQPSFGGANVLGVTTTEMLSNQLSSWLSQISKDFDVGFSYHPGDEVTSEQVEVALSTQLLNDRISINGNIDFNTQNNNTTTNNSNIVGDFQVEVKITRNGKLRVKAFTRANDNYLYETAPYTNGIGIFYREEFSSWDKLFQSYWEKIAGKKEEEPAVKKEEKKKKKKAK